MALPKLTLGIEEEYQIIDPRTRELANDAESLLAEGEKTLGEQIKPEFMRSQVEVGTNICHDISEARSEVARLRRAVADLAAKHDLAVAAASTHPISAWSSQRVTEGDRYMELEDNLRDVARQLLIFGMHVHVGIEDPEMRIDVINQARYFLPHLLALSTSSPFWQGRDTGLRSYRSVIFENMPRSGIPPSFRAWTEYEGFINTLIKTGSIDEPTKIWWDLRPHAKFPTIEFRINDVCTKVDEVLCLAALCQSIVQKLIKLRYDNNSWRQYRHHLISENKWRAMRYGLDGKLIDFGRQSEVPVRDLVVELLELVDDVVDDLGCRAEVEYVHTILEYGTSAERQLATYERTGNLEAVVDQLIEETLEGI